MAKKTSDPRKWKPATLGIHGVDRVEHAHFAVSTPIVHTSNYYFNTTQEVYDFMKAKSEGKNVSSVETAIASARMAISSAAFPSMPQNASNSLPYLAMASLNMSLNSVLLMYK